MLTINQQHLKRLETHSIFTIPKNMNFAGFRTLIPNKYISKNGFIRYIKLPDEQKLKLKKDEETRIVTIGELKAR